MEVVTNTALHVMPVQTYPTSVHTGIYQTTLCHAPEHSCLQINTNMASLKTQKATTVSFNLHLTMNV
jgi:hypothetical protein